MDVLPVTDLNRPVGADEFSALMENVGPWLPDVAEAPVGLAVSGGGDSLALAWLAKRWRQHVVAFVVDHALRVESAAEARLTARRLQAMGIDAHVLRLAPFPEGRLQERARDARFEALEEACVEAGCLDLLVAHHLHDQDETVWMRQHAGSGPSGLAGMEAVALRGRIRIVRPCLMLPPERLRATLRAAGLAWIEDPSNQNRRFERVRWRQDLSLTQRDHAREWQVAAQVLRCSEDRELARVLAENAVWHSAGWVHLKPDGIKDSTIAALIRLVSGRRYRPSRKQVQALVSRGQGGLGGVMMRPAGRFGDGVMLVREERAVEGLVAAKVGAIWDGRWRCTADALPADGLIGTLGERALKLDARRLGLPASALRTLPALWRNGQVIGLPDVLEGIGTVPFVWAGGVPVTGERGSMT